MRKTLIALGLAAALWAQPAPSRAEPPAARDLALAYRIYFGGFEVLKLTVDLMIAPETYAMELNFRTLGLIGRMFPWTMKAYSRGVLAGEEIRPHAAGQRNTWRDRARWVDLRYPDGLPVVTDAKPAAATDGSDKVPAHALVGTIDLASAIVKLSRKMAAGRGCDGKIAVFDGRRRYDLVFERLGETRIRRSGYTVFQGKAVNCSAAMDRLAGFKRRKSYGGWGENGRTASVWMARPFADAPPVPVRIEIETRWGDLMVHLVRAELVADGVTRELAEAK